MKRYSMFSCATNDILIVDDSEIEQGLYNFEYYTVDGDINDAWSWSFNNDMNPNFHFEYDENIIYLKDCEDIQKLYYQLYDKEDGEIEEIDNSLFEKIKINLEKYIIHKEEFEKNKFQWVHYSFNRFNFYVILNEEIDIDEDKLVNSNISKKQDGAKFTFIYDKNLLHWLVKIEDGISKRLSICDIEYFDLNDIQKYRLLKIEHRYVI